MEPIDGNQQFFRLCSQLDPILETLASMRDKIERIKSLVSVDDFFSILLAYERINEAKERLLKIAEEREKKERLEREPRFSLR